MGLNIATEADLALPFLITAVLPQTVAPTTPPVLGGPPYVVVHQANYAQDFAPVQIIFYLFFSSLVPFCWQLARADASYSSPLHVVAGSFTAVGNVARPFPVQTSPATRIFRTSSASI